MPQLYREGDHCFVQQRLALDGQFNNLLPRRTETENGEKISEWATGVDDIRRFLTDGDQAEFSTVCGQ